ncbi:MAG: flavodoxin family protein [Eggerthella lenta]
MEADGLVVGTPVFYAGANGALMAVLDRLFYAASARLRFKPAAAVASARRAGTTPAIDQINKYFQINCMPVVSSNYWLVHGRSVEDVRQDAEGLQICVCLARTWLGCCRRRPLRLRRTSSRRS